MILAGSHSWKHKRNFEVRVGGNAWHESPQNSGCLRELIGTEHSDKVCGVKVFRSVKLKHQ